MSYYNQPYGQGANTASSNLQFYPSSYSSVSGHTTPSQASYGGYGSGNAASTYPSYGAGSSGAFGAGPGIQGVSGRMGESGGLRTGWLAAFGTEGYEGEPGLMEELGVNFGHIKTKVSELDRVAATEAGLTQPKDSDSAQPLDEALASHHGRQRSIRRPPLLGTLRHVSRPLGQVFLWVYLRHCAVRFDGAALDVCTHDTAAGSQ